MDLQPLRRKANTYGKGNRKILVHDIFDIGATPSHVPLTSKSTHSNATSQLASSNDNPPSVVAIEQNTWADSHAANGVVDSMAIRQSTPSSTTGSSPASPQHISADMFEIQSSDEEAALKHKGPLNKRRRVMPATSKVEPIRSNKDLARPRVQTSKQSDRALKTTSKSSGLKASHSGVTKSTLKPVRRPQPLASSYFSSPKSMPRDARVSSGSSAPMSDTSASPPRVSRQTTPKRKIALSDDGPTNAPSPSDLQLTSLRLTPERSAPQAHHLSEDVEMSDSSTNHLIQSKGRKRLVDRLDGPRPRTPEKLNAGAGASGFEPVESSLSHPLHGCTTPSQLSRSTSDSDVHNIQKSTVEESKTAPPARVARTYAKQRSHLSDMLDGLESTSQPSSQQSYSQPTSFTSLASQMDLGLDDDSDEAGTFKQPKSIHELRRAGAITKFDNELSTVLDEIESGLKSPRIRGLIQLLEKLADITFLAHFQDSGWFSQFSDCAGASLDEVSATLMIVVFQRMTSAIHVSPKTSAQILDALYRLPRSLAVTNRPLSKVAKDRRQNLPKILLTELTEYERTASSQADHPPFPISLIFFTALESTLRTLIKHGERFQPLPSSLVEDLLLALATIQQALSQGSGGEESLRILNILLSTLEIASFNHDLVALIENSPQFPALRESLTGLLKWGHQAQQSQLEQACLKFIVSLSNNQPNICQEFAKEQLISGVYSVVDDHFCRVAASAVQAQELDGVKLDAAVLALGCLLNFADCADAARERMLESVQGGRSLIDGLIDIFNSYFDLTSEADSLDQAQVLIPLGYISMLLCTLCLNQRACELIAQSSKGAGLEQLFSAVETFLIPLRQVEMDLAVDGESRSGSFDRFMAIYQAVKQKVA
ncbi:uncharacterized protein A1O9_03208 [Exophiala aquamarina CBS 119918]|uniref:Wings apart-like protein C-terminal domain-containing protein n=1 Tax=Exophiala aquamarina CBS 119918 TaxID=1182545 RepID=A0A072Q158_9EURO|nr:uncharacterized protein A1O9_03208 [Exophiala aquamarina CBS 119918]KEF61640.1 hypothetical protein A1O9_03208 [Exophiala aquamarina CBS 119918]